MDEFLAIGATLEHADRDADDGDLRRLVHAVGPTPFLAYVAPALADTDEDEEDGSPLDPLILDGLIHV